ncbi:MAG TPA: endo alpha-1,4 polygalactosaminidase [Streptosporangiaceae bacterium]|nr:endo alpha-1,4 polygalactosaminidase [Streptosporangiaceae bacterium]
MRATRSVVLMAVIAMAAASVVLSWPGTGSSGLAATTAAAAPAIPAPTAAGRLHIAGPLRDGRTVRATGLYWRSSLLPAKDSELSFEVSYTWQSCAATCVSAADSTATPFAAHTYIVGHADTGRQLRVTETATEVVETDPATFAFSVVHASVSVTTSEAVGAYPARAPPKAEFVNGTPEHRTASDAEYFQVDPPHYNSADGVPLQQYRVDGSSWRTLPASRVFYTGKLAIGMHRVQVRTANTAGATTTAFRWRVVPMPRPVPCRRSHGRSCWYPPHLNSSGQPMRWDWQIGRVRPLQRTGARAVDIYDIDGFLTTRKEVRAIHRTWQAATLPHPRLICYIDMAWEDYRPDASPGDVFPADTLGKVYYGYPQERWVDFRQLDALKPMLDERLKMCARKGFDAVELDDIDSFDPPSTTGFHLTPGDAENFLAYAFNEIHRLGMTGLWKNSPYLSWWGRRYADGAIVEECYVYRQCTAAQLRGSRQYGITCTALAGRTPCGWDDFSTDRTREQPTGKWVGEAEYAADRYVCNPGQSCTGRRSFAAFCRNLYAPAWGFAAVKFDVDLDGRLFYPCPTGT